ncbi:MAG: cytochrome-c oxidase, cbb3-type subunit III [Alphaproteobacteria bacterium]
MVEPEQDALSGRETTGHEWDGLKELNTPLPRWWLYVWYVTIVWALIYTVVYPSWPIIGGYYKGLIGYSSRAELAKDLDAVKQGRASWINRFEQSSVSEIAADNDLLIYAMAGGRAVFAENCAPCHSAAGSGSVGYPSLADDDWLWGGKIDDIYTSIRYGIRGDHDETRISDMPAFGTDELLNPQQIADVTAHVLSLSDGGAANANGLNVFADECASCHADDGTGNQDLGAPNLVDAIWLNGGGVDAIKAQVATPKHGVMPAWVDRLDDVTLKQVSVYVHSLGGGQ